MSHDTEPTPKINTEVPTPSALDLKDEHYADKKARTDRWGRGKQVGAAAVIGGVVIGGGALIMSQLNNHNDAPNNTEPTNEAPAVLPGQTSTENSTPTKSPSEDPTNPANTITTPAPTETETSAEPTKSTLEYTASDADVQKYLALDDDQFKQLKPEQRVEMVYAGFQSYYSNSTGDRNLGSMANDIYTGSQNTKELLPAKISPDNTPEEAFRVAWYVRLMPYLLKEQGGATWNKDLAHKAIIGGSMDPGNGNTQDIIDATTKAISLNSGNALSAVQVGADGWFGSNVVFNSTETGQDSTGHKNYTINYTDNADNSQHTMVLSWVTDASGQGIWLPQY